MSTFWGADVPISMPVPPKERIWVDFDGMGFTEHGIAHYINDNEWEELLTPTFAPSDFVPGDEHPLSGA
jgi:hypothetical protein